MRNENSPDFKLPAERRQGLYIRTFRVAADGTRYDDSGVVLVDSEPDVAAYHASATWPICKCPQHREG